MSTRLGHFNFDIAADRNCPVPIARIGGLPIAIIDRAESTELMVELALDRRDTRCRR